MKKKKRNRLSNAIFLAQSADIDGCRRLAAGMCSAAEDGHRNVHRACYLSSAPTPCGSLVDSSLGGYSAWFSTYLGPRIGAEAAITAVTALSG